MTSTEEVPIGPNTCHNCGGEYGRHDPDCISRLASNVQYASDRLTELHDDLKQVRKVLYKYQARYHGASVMDQRDWDEGQRCLALLDKWISK